MRGRGGTTIGEVLGKIGGDRAQSRKLTLHDLPHLLGEGMPDLEFHALGRLRLIHALERRFGKNYRSVPGISNIISEFDAKAKTALHHHRILKRLGKKEK